MVSLLWGSCNELKLVSKAFLHFPWEFQMFMNWQVDMTLALVWTGEIVLYWKVWKCLKIILKVFSPHWIFYILDTTFQSNASCFSAGPPNLGALYTGLALLTGFSHGHGSFNSCLLYCMCHALFSCHFYYGFLETPFCESAFIFIIFLLTPCNVTHTEGRYHW